MDPDGRVTFVSRLKDMLKVGGENVSAAEVESCLLRHPAVSIVQVVSAPDDYYVEVPAAFIFVAEWPMTGTKIRKAILSEMIAADLKEKGISQAPKIETAPAG